MTQTNLFMKPTTERELVVAEGEGMEEGWGRKVGLAFVSFLYIEQINNKVILYSREN